MAKHSDYCPIALGVDILGDRWTPLLIRELMVGSTGFNEIHRGVPTMSRSLLSQRLRLLEKRGLVSREQAGSGRQVTYRLTPAGEGLTPIIWEIGHWAAEWAFGDPREEECDGLTVLWRMHQHAIASKLPKERTFIHVVMTGPGAAQGWLDIERQRMSVCRDHPGHDSTLAVEAPTPDLNRWLVGRTTWQELAREGRVRLLGPTKLTKAFPSWFDTSLFAKGLNRRSLHVDTDLLPA